MFIVTLHSSGAGLENFPNLKTLMLDHNNFQNVANFPVLAKVETLSIGHNPIRNQEQFLVSLVKKVRVT